MPLYFLEYKILDNARSDCMTYFGSMSAEDDAADTGENIELLGRWSTVGEASGYCVCRATDAKALNNWLYNWVNMATIKVWPVLDDNQARKIISGAEPSYTVDYSSLNTEPGKGESLYFIKYKFHTEKRVEGNKLFASLTQEQDLADAGNNKCLGRYHDLGLGSGFAICSSRSEEDLFKWAFNWSSMCDCEIKPVVHDNECRAVIQAKPDFEKKLAALQAKMAAN